MGSLPLAPKGCPTQDTAAWVTVKVCPYRCLFPESVPGALCFTMVMGQGCDRALQTGNRALGD